MLLQRVSHFVHMRACDRRNSLHFHTRRVLGRVPLLPVQVSLKLSSGETLPFWWSYLPRDFHEDRTLCEYWGDDCGTLRFAWEFLRSGMSFLDVGSFHGIFSLLAGKKVGPQGSVVAFEPSERERRRFRLHMLMNGVNGARLEPYAVSSRTEKLTFFTVAPSAGMMNSLKRPEIDQPVQQTVVPTVSLDDYLDKHSIDRIDLMKIDVEGGEIEAFRGAANLLQSIRPVVVCEVLDFVTRPWGYAAREIVDHLQKHDYEWFEFRDEGSIIPHLHRSEYPEPRNYLAVPIEKLPLVDRWRRYGHTTS